MDYKKLAQLLYPGVNEGPEDIEKRYPERNLPEGAMVTRFAPSPTGFVHFGGLFPTRVSERLAHQSGGIFYLRIEDTDSKREVDGAEENLISTLSGYGIDFDEGVTTGGEKGSYGPYRQSERAGIYHVFAKMLVEKGSAYPCFCTPGELDAMRAEQEAQKVDTGYYGKWALWRDADIEKIEARLAAGDKFVLRFRSEGDVSRKIKFTDLIKGTIEITENDKDHVLLKSDGIPTYHFAHAVDDHLMRTTHVVRGEEWLPSLPFHVQLFSALGFRLPKYLHISQLMKLEGGSKKKLSKRDAGVDMRYYNKLGYPPETLVEYIMTLLNSNYEEWRSANPGADFTDFKFSVKKMSPSGCLLDTDKLNDVSKNTVSRMSAEKVYGDTLCWAKTYDPDFAAVLSADPEKAKKIFAIGRGGKKPRKDITVWEDCKPYISLFYDEYFERIDDIAPEYSRSDIKAALEAFCQSYDESADRDAWFENIKAVAQSLGYAAEVKEYKQNPDGYPGHVGDISMFIRVALTGKMNSPDMYDIMHIIGKEKTIARISGYAENI